MVVEPLQPDKTKHCVVKLDKYESLGYTDSFAPLNREGVDKQRSKNWITGFKPNCFNWITEQKGSTRVSANQERTWGPCLTPQGRTKGCPEPPGVIHRTNVPLTLGVATTIHPALAQDLILCVGRSPSVTAVHFIIVL